MVEVQTRGKCLALPYWVTGTDGLPRRAGGHSEDCPAPARNETLCRGASEDFRRLLRQRQTRYAEEQRLPEKVTALEGCFRQGPPGFSRCGCQCNRKSSPNNAPGSLKGRLSCRCISRSRRFLPEGKNQDRWLRRRWQA